MARKGSTGNAIIIIVAIILFAVIAAMWVWFDDLERRIGTGDGGDDSYIPGGGGGGGSVGTGCPTGYCNSNGVCCPSNLRYSCQGSCYASQQDALSASGGSPSCASHRIQC